VLIYFEKGEAPAEPLKGKLTAAAPGVAVATVVVAVVVAAAAATSVGICCTLSVLLTIYCWASVWLTVNP